MDFDDRPEPAIRLANARKAAGFENPKAASEYFGWKYDTYAQHENGTRGISRAASRYAAAFRINEAWLMFGPGLDPKPEAPQSSVIPAHIAQDGRGQPDEMLIAFLTAAKAGGGRDVWRVKNDTMVSVGYLPGDYILVDHRSPGSALDGDTVLLALNDLHFGSAANMLAYFSPPLAIVLGGFAGHIQTHHVDNQTVEIKGNVIASWRLQE